MLSPYGHPLVDLRFNSPDLHSVVATLNHEPVFGVTTKGKKYCQLLFQIQENLDGSQSELKNSHAIQTLWIETDYFSDQVSRLAGCKTEDLPDDKIEFLTKALETSSLALKVQLNRDGYLQVRSIIGRGDYVTPTKEIGLAKVIPNAKIPVFPITNSPDCEALKANYDWVKDPADVLNIVDKINQASCIGVDLETSFREDVGDFWNASDGSIRLIQLSAEINGEIWTVCVDAWEVNIKPILKALMREDLTKVIHYLPFEQEWLSYHYGVGQFTNVLDTCLAWKILERQFCKIDQSYKAASGKLAEVALRLWNLELDKDDQTADWGVLDLPSSQREYAALDAALMKPLYDALKEIAEDLGVWEQIKAASLLTAKEALSNLPRPKFEGQKELEDFILAATTKQNLAIAAKRIRQSFLPHQAKQALAKTYIEQLKGI